MAPVRRPPPAIRATLRPPKLVYGWEGDDKRRGRVEVNKEREVGEGAKG